MLKAACLRNHPSEPPADEAARDALGPWPDVPADFWTEQPTKVNWGAGTFANKVQYFCDHHQQLTYTYIELFEVTFHAGDLARLLNTKSPDLMRGVLPSNAKPNDRKYEDHAHEAAKLIRLNGVSKSAAFRKALENNSLTPPVAEASHQRALRHSYDAMYDSNGVPIKNDAF